MGIFDGMMMGQDYINKGLNNQMLQDQLQAYPELVQAQADYAKSLAGVEGVTAQYAPQMAQADLTKSNLFNRYYGPTAQANIGLTNAQASQAGANAGLIGTEAQKNQFLLNNPGLLAPGIAGQFAGINYLQQHYPQMFSSGTSTNTAPQSGIGAPPIMNSSVAPLPGIGGAGMFQPPTAPAPVNNPPAIQPPSATAPMGIGGSMFGGNPVANGMVNTILAPMNKDAAQAAYYKARLAQLVPTIDPNTGQPTSVNTTPNTTQDQRTIAAIQRVSPIISRLSNNLSQFQTLGGEAQLKASQLGNYVLGQNNSLGNQYAQGQADLQKAPEGLLKAWGLNVTDESLKRMQETVQPIFGESAKGYQDRIVNTLLELESNKGQAGQRLSGGTPVNNSSSSQQSPSDIIIPSFKSKTQFQNWYKGLTNQQQAIVRAQLGGK